MKGVAGKILRINLTNKQISIDRPDEAFYRTYLGGAGFVSYYLLKEVPKGIDALSPENKLIFAVGPMAGFPVGGATRNCIGAKSPVTDGYAKSEVGGHWPSDLKRAGYDGIIVEGKAASPVYVWIDPQGNVEIRDASHLWGKDCLETQDIIAEDVGDKQVRVAAIGPGGENLVRYACVMNDLKDAAGRGGMGAVMGSKNLKAIAVKGTTIPEAADRDKVFSMARAMGQNFYDNPLFNKALHDVGTGINALMIGGMETGNLPVHNFDRSHFPEVANMTADVVLEKFGKGMEGCTACPVRCKKVCEIGEPWNVDPRNGGPEYESLAALGSTCDIHDPAVLIKANELANLYSLDTISLGVTIAFGMECFEKGLLNLEDTDGIDLRFGNNDALLKVIEQIAHRKGVGDLLAEGSKKASEKIGRGAEDLAMHVKGIELPMHEPRFKQGMGIIYAVEAHGADHNAGYHDPAFVADGPGMEHLKKLGAVGPLPPDDLSDGKVANVRAAHLLNLFKDAAIFCIFLPWSIDEQVELISATTGWDYTLKEALELGERIAAMGRIYNYREGLSAKDDRMPKRFFGGTQNGALKDGGIDEAAMDRAVKSFYAMMGWNEDGKPTQAKLDELGIGWAAEYLD